MSPPITTSEKVGSLMPWGYDLVMLSIRVESPSFNHLSDVYWQLTDFNIRNGTPREIYAMIMAKLVEDINDDYC